MKKYETIEDVSAAVDLKSFILDNTYITNYNRINIFEKIFTFISIITLLIFISINIIEAIKVNTSSYTLLTQYKYDNNFCPFIKLFYIYFVIAFTAIKIYLNILKRKIINELLNIKRYMCENELKKFKNYEYLKEDEIKRILTTKIYVAADIKIEE